MSASSHEPEAVAWIEGDGVLAESGPMQLVDNPLGMFLCGGDCFAFGDAVGSVLQAIEAGEAPSVPALQVANLRSLLEALATPARCVVEARIHVAQRRH
jgi:hypothetical protein